jgi:hypothetical protein
VPIAATTTIEALGVEGPPARRIARGLFRGGAFALTKNFKSFNCGSSAHDFTASLLLLAKPTILQGRKRHEGVCGRTGCGRHAV